MAESEVDLESVQYEKHREAGEILAQVREETAERVEVGASHLEVAEYAEDRIRELGGKPAFPVNISIDEEAAHATPSIDDESTFGEEMINLDIGVHIDGWLADTAITVDLSGNPELAEASEQALEAAIDVIEPGIETGEIGAEIEDVIDGYGFNPVVNLTGHGLGHWEQHTSPNIPNRAVSQGRPSRSATSSRSNRSRPTAAAKSRRVQARRSSRSSGRATSGIARLARHCHRSPTSSERSRLRPGGSRRIARRWRFGG